MEQIVGKGITYWIVKPYIVHGDIHYIRYKTDEKIGWFLGTKNRNGNIIKLDYQELNTDMADKCESDFQCKLTYHYLP